MYKAQSILLQKLVEYSRKKYERTNNTDTNTIKLSLYILYNINT